MVSLAVFSILKCCLRKETFLQMTKCPGGKDISLSWCDRRLVNHIFVTFLKGYLVYAFKDMALWSWWAT